MGGSHVVISSLRLLTLKVGVEFRSERKIWPPRPICSDQVAQKLAYEHFMDGRNTQALISSVSKESPVIFKPIMLLPYLPSYNLILIIWIANPSSGKKILRYLGFVLKLAIRPVRFFSLLLCTIPKTLLFYSFIHGCQSKCMKPCLWLL